VLGKSLTFNVIEVITAVVVLLNNSSVIVPDGVAFLPSIWIETPEIVIAPGVNIAEATAEVVSVVLPNLLSKKEVALTRLQVEASKKLPDCLDSNVAII
jgi:hypothetical protein